MRRWMVIAVGALSLIGCLQGKETAVGAAEAPRSKSLASKAKEKTFEGFDLQGKKRLCSAMAADLMCTMNMTDSDIFAQKCRESGYTAFQCDCHDWLCSENIATTVDR